jgi:glycosyltransferase involved in cell wall biosynthesis
VRILICASSTPLPPTTTGYRRQIMGLVPELSRHHDVRLVGYLKPDQTSNPKAEAEMRIVPYPKPDAIGNAVDLVQSVLSKRPLRTERFVRGLSGPLTEELERFKPDVVHVGPGKLAGLRRYLNDYPKILNVMDTWHLNVVARADASAGIRSALFRRDVELIKNWEASEYRHWDRVVPSNSDDLETLRSLDPSIKMTLIPIGFDAGAYAPDPAATRDPDQIMFHGAMNYAPNVVCAEYLAREILPRVRAEHPSAQLVIVGRDPTPRVQQLGSLPGVKVTGGVEDMRSWLTSSRVWAGPFRNATGIKTKLLEAMATDLPCVVTPIGGRGLDLESGALLVGDTTEELAAHIVRVLKDKSFANALGRAGGDYVRQTYDWPVVAASFARLYEEVIGERRPGKAAAA